jgi:hypothetical protein
MNFRCFSLLAGIVTLLSELVLALWQLRRALDPARHIGRARPTLARQAHSRSTLQADDVPSEQVILDKDVAVTTLATLAHERHFFTSRSEILDEKFSAFVVDRSEKPDEQKHDQNDDEQATAAPRIGVSGLVVHQLVDFALQHRAPPECSAFRRLRFGGLVKVLHEL